MDLTYVELFAGAGGMSLGLEMAGWRCLAHAEWEDHPRAVLRKHWPDLPLLGDVTQVDGRQFKGVTMLTGGSPCQDLSVAGKRAGMVEGSGTRSSLYFEQIRIWKESEAPLILWENVYGAFSSNAGRDFAAVLSAIVGAAVPVPADGWRGAGVASGPAGVAAWRTLDAQYFGVPQRRRRVFVLGTRSGGIDPAEVLSLAESLSGHLAASGTSGEGIAADAGAGAPGCGKPIVFAQNTRDEVREIPGDIVCALAAEPGMKQTNYVIQSANAGAGAPSGNAVAVNISDGVARLDSVMGTLDADGASTTAIGAQTRGVVLTYDACGNVETSQASEVPFVDEWHNQDSRIKPVSVAATLNNNAEGREGHLVLMMRQREGKPGGGKGPLLSEGKSLTLGTANDQVVFPTLSMGAHTAAPGSNGQDAELIHTAMIQAGVGRPRRLTPVECERLMGWPDGHTAEGIDESGKPYRLADTARYKLCGNGIASPVTAWLGFRLREYLTRANP